MKSANFLDKKLIEFLVTNSLPGVYGFINYMDKSVWLSFSENVSEAIVRNIKLIGERQHKIRSLENWDVCVFQKTKTKQEAKNSFRLLCQTYKTKGLTILNKELRYCVWGEIAPDFRNNTQFLYYIRAGAKNGKSAVLGIFTQAREGELALKNFKAGKLKEFPLNSKRLVTEFKNTDKDKQEYNRLFKNETLS